MPFPGLPLSKLQGAVQQTAEKGRSDLQESLKTAATAQDPKFNADERAQTLQRFLAQLRKKPEGIQAPDNN